MLVTAAQIQLFTNDILMTENPSLQAVYKADFQRPVQPPLFNEKGYRAYCAKFGIIPGDRKTRTISPQECQEHLNHYRPADVAGRNFAQCINEIRQGSRPAADKSEWLHDLHPALASPCYEALVARLSSVHLFGDAVENAVIATHCITATHVADPTRFSRQPADFKEMCWAWFGLIMALAQMPGFGASTNGAYPAHHVWQFLVDNLPGYLRLYQTTGALSGLTPEQGEKIAALQALDGVVSDIQRMNYRFHQTAEMAACLPQEVPPPIVLSATPDGVAANDRLTPAGPKAHPERP